MTLIDEVRASAYTIPTDRPESEGTLAWDSTTLIVAEVRAGDVWGLNRAPTPGPQPERTCRGRAGDRQLGPLVQRDKDPPLDRQDVPDRVRGAVPSYHPAPPDEVA